MNDVIFIRQLHVETTIGAYPWEREIRQVVVLDLDMEVDTSTAGHTDRLADTVDYNAVAQRVSELVSKAHFELVEAVAEAVADCVLGEFAVLALTLTVTKPHAVSAAQGVGIRIHRVRPALN